MRASPIHPAGIIRIFDFSAKMRSDRPNKKSMQLAMPIGTASHRLRKMIMLQLLRELRKDSCLRCLARIKEPEDLAVDHKSCMARRVTRTVLGSRNIGFSHRRCNSIARRSAKGRKLGPSIHRKIGPPDNAWCTGHADFLSLTAFNQNKSTWAGVQSFCKSCTAARYRYLRQRAWPHVARLI